MSNSSRRSWGYKGISIIIISFVAIIFLLLGTGLSWAGSYAWTESGPFGGPPSAGGISPNYANDNEIALCAGGAVYRTQDKGDTWTKVYSQYYFEEWRYSPDYANDHTIFAFDSKNLYKIVNWGAPVKISTPLVYMNRIAISPNFAGDKTIFLSCGEWDDNGNPTNGGILKSTNGGTTWQVIHPMQASGPYVIFFSIALPPNYNNNGTADQKKVIASGDDSLGASSFFFFDGASWSNPFLAACDYCTGDTAFFGDDIVFDPGFDGNTNTTFYIPTADANHLSNRSGVLKTNMSLGSLSGLWTVLPLPGAGTGWFDPGNINLKIRDNILYAGGHWWNDTEKKFSGGLYSYDLAGGPWVSLSDSLDDIYVRGFLLSPTFASDHSIYLATLSGLYRTTNGGSNWNLSPTGHKSYQFSHGVGSNPQNNASVTYFLASKGGGVFKSTDNGNNWTQKNNGLDSHIVTTLGLAPNYSEGSGNQTLFAACSKEADPDDPKSRLIYRSIDGGNNWATSPGMDVEAQLNGDYIMFFVIPSDYDGSINKTLFIHTDGKGADGNPMVFQSTNNGDTWSQYNPSALGGLEGIYTATLTPGVGTAANTWVVAGYNYNTFGSDIFRSPDKGVTWYPQSSTGLFTPGQTNHSTGPLVPPGVVDDNTILMSISRKGVPHTGIYRSTDLGATWTEVKSFNYETILAPTWYRNSPADGGKSVIFFSTVWDNNPSSANHGIYKSVDGGLTWAQVGKDVPGFNRTGGIHYTPAPPGNNPAGPTLFATPLGGKSFGFWQYSAMSITLTAPADGGTTYDACSYFNLLIFQWNYIGGNVDSFKKLEIQFSADDFATYKKAPLVPWAVQYIPTPAVWKKVMLLPGEGGGIVKWRLVATMADKSQAPSVPFSFTIGAPQAAGVLNLSHRSKGNNNGTTLPPVMTWNNNCNTKFKIWFGSAADFTLTTTKKKALAFNDALPTDNLEVFSQLLTSGQWTAIQSVVGGSTVLPIYWYVEGWDAANRYSKTDPVMNFTLTP